MKRQHAIQSFRGCRGLQEDCAYSDSRGGMQMRNKMERSSMRGTGRGNHCRSEYSRGRQATDASRKIHV